MVRVQSICVLAVAGLALVIALGWLYASVPQPPPVHLIKCATVSEGSPCGPDPAMQQLGFPRPLPFNAPPEVDPPQFAPSANAPSRCSYRLAAGVRGDLARLTIPHNLLVLADEVIE